LVEERERERERGRRIEVIQVVRDYGLKEAKELRVGALKSSSN
jgi:ribosomal protein L7/L12